MKHEEKGSIKRFSSARLSSIIGSTEKVKITRDEESMTIDSGRGIETRLSITNGEMKKVTCEGYGKWKGGTVDVRYRSFQPQSRLSTVRKDLWWREEWRDGGGFSYSIPH